MQRQCSSAQTDLSYTGEAVFMMLIGYLLSVEM